MDEKAQATSGDVNVHTSTCCNSHKYGSTMRRTPYRIAAIIMSVIIFASAILPGWFVVNTQKEEYNGEEVQYDCQGLPYFIPSYIYRDHGNVNLSMLLHMSNNDHYTVTCAPIAKSLSVFTFVFFILSLLMYATASHIHYPSFMINCSSVISAALLILQAIYFNPNNISIFCSHIIRATYNVGIVWWVCLLLLFIATIYNIMTSKKMLHISPDNSTNKNNKNNKKIVVVAKKHSTKNSNNSWCCEFCGHQNTLTSEFCESCGYERLEET